MLNRKPFFNASRILGLLLAVLLCTILFPRDILAQESPVPSQEESATALQHPEATGLVTPLALYPLSLQRLQSYLHFLLGSSYPNGYCMKFVADVFEDLGAARSTACCASRYASFFTRSTDIQSIPVGADVFFDGLGGGPCPYCNASYFGHIGIYIGNGRFVHADSGRIQISLLQDDPYFSSHFRGWGYHGGISFTNQESGFLSGQQSGLYKVNTSGSNLMLRAGPSTNDYILARLADQSQVSVCKSGQEWAYVKTDGLSGYVNKAYLVKEPVSITYPDLNAGQPGYAQILNAMTNRLVLPPSSFSFNPQGNITRREWIRALYRMAGSPRDDLRLYGVEREWTGTRWKNRVFYSEDPVSRYRDLSGYDPDVDAIRFALQSGWVKADSTDQVGLDRFVNDRELLTNLKAWLEYEGIVQNTQAWENLLSQERIPAVSPLCTRQEMSRIVWWAFTE